MKPRFNRQSILKSSHTFGTALAFCMFLSPGLAHGQAKFTFVNNGPFDGAGIGGNMTVFDLTELINVKATTVQIVGQDGSLASAPTANFTSSTNANAMGVLSANNVNGNSSNDRDFDPGEKWVFKFDVDVKLVDIDFAGWTSNDSQFTLSFSDATPDIVLFGTAAGDTFSLGNTPIAAGVEITMGVTNVTGDNIVRVPYLTVAAVPAPATGANLKWTGVGGNDWNTTPSNTNWADLDNANAPIAFVSGDNVTIDTAASIAVDAGGITAGNATVSAASGTVSLSGGNLTADSLTKSGGSTLSIAGTNAFTNGTTLTGGTLVAENNDALGSTLILADGGSLNTSLAVSAMSTPVTTGVAGAVLDTAANVEFSGAFASTGAAVEASNNLTKTGSGILTLTKTGAIAFGAQSNVGAVGTSIDFDISAGGVVFSGNGSRYLGGTCTWDAPVTLGGGLVMLHGSTINGSGTINVTSGTTLVSRLNRGTSTVATPIQLSSGVLTIETPAGNSQMTIDGSISGNHSIIKDGNGVLLVTADNSYGGTTVQAGTLRVGGSLTATSGSLGTGAITLNTTTSTGTIEFSRNNALVVPGAISGVGNVVVVNGASGSTALAGTSSYTGTTNLNGGTLVASVLADGGAASSIGAAANGAADFVIRGEAKLSYTGPATTTNRNFTLGGALNGSNYGGGTISADGSGPIAFTSTDPMGADGTGSTTRILGLAGSASGTSSIAMQITNGIASVTSVVKSGSTTWRLTGANTYTGDTTINDGILELGPATDLANSSFVRINGNTSVLKLDDNVTDQVEELWIDGVQMASGTWGGPLSTATHKDDHFVGAGLLDVNTGAASNDYDTWATSYSLVEGPTGDDDKDGLSNENEYAFGLIPNSGSSVNPISVPYNPGTATFSYTRRNPALGTGLGYTYQYSTDLSDPQGWTTFTPTPVEDTNSGTPTETITVHVPAPQSAEPRLFLRVKASN